MGWFDTLYSSMASTVGASLLARISFKITSRGRTDSARPAFLQTDHWHAMPRDHPRRLDGQSIPVSCRPRRRRAGQSPSSE